MKDLSRIKNIVISYMENRSFDHLIGYLNLPGNHPHWDSIEGITKAMHYYTGSTHRPHPLTADQIQPDPPHERENVDLQMNSPGKAMDGFVSSYLKAFPDARGDAVMEYCGPKNVYVTDFLARNFAVCDHWHACLPASTLPNRLMAMSGYALVDRTPNSIFELTRNLFYDDPDDLVYEAREA